MVSPRKRAVGVRSLRSSPPRKNSPSNSDDWISGTTFQFAESPVIPRREFKSARQSTGRGAKVKTVTDVKTRRHSVLLKRLDLPLPSFGSSPTSNIRKTRRQSIAVTASSRSLSALKPPEPPKATSPKLKRNSRSAAAMLPPKKGAPVKVEKAAFTSPVKIMRVSESVTQCTISHSPVKFYNSPTKAPKGLTRETSTGRFTGKRKAESNKVESSPKKMKVEASESKSSPVKNAKKSLDSPSPVRKKKLRSGIPLRSVSSEGSLAVPLEKSSARSPKKDSKGEKKGKQSEVPKKSAAVAVSKSPESKSKETSKTPKKTRKRGKTESPKKSKTVSASKLVSPKSQVSSPRKLRKPAVKTTKTPDLQKEKSAISPKGKRVDLSKSRKDEVAKSPKRQSPVAKKSATVAEKSPVKSSPVTKKLATPIKKSPEKLSPIAKKATTPKPFKQKEISINSPKKTKTPIVKKVSSTPKSQQKKGNKLSNATSPKKDIKKTPEKDSLSQKKNVLKANLVRKSTSPQSKKLQEKTSVDTPKKEVVKKSKATPTPAKKSVKISTPVSVKRLQCSLETSEVIERSTRSSARNSRRVRLVGESPKKLPSSFRKTPKSKQKSELNLPNDDDVGASPVLSAREQLNLIRARSPLKFKSSIVESKVKPYTPKPDSPPSNVLRKTLKKKVAQKLQATTKVEVHQLMNGEISRPVALVTGSKTTTASLTVTHSKSSPRVSAVTAITPRKALLRDTSSNLQGNGITATTPVSLSNLPPTPTSSRKREGFIESSRTITSRKTSIVSCQRALSTTTPRSSTPIEEDEVDLKLLNVDSIIQKESNFTDESINTDESDDESLKLSEDTESVKLSEDIGKEVLTPEKPKKSYCSLM